MILHILVRGMGVLTPVRKPASGNTLSFARKPRDRWPSGCGRRHAASRQRALTGGSRACGPNLLEIASNI